MANWKPWTADEKLWFARVDKISDTPVGFLTDKVERQLCFQGSESHCREVMRHLLNTGAFDQGEMTDNATNDEINWQPRGEEPVPEEWTREIMVFTERVQRGMNKGFHHERQEHTNGQTVTRNVTKGTNG